MRRGTSGLQIPEQEVTLRDLARVLQRRWTLVVSIAAACFVLAVVLWRILPRQYEATATVRVHNPRSNSLSNMLAGVNAPEGGAADALSADIEVQSQANMLQSNSLALRVIRKLKLDQMQEFSGAGKEQEARQLSTFEHKLSVKPVGGTSMIEIGFLDADPNLAAAVVNDLVQELSEQSSEQQARSTQTATRTLREQLEDLRVRSEELQARVAQMQRNSGIYSVGTTDAAGRPQAYSAVLAQFEHAATVLSSTDENRILKQGIAQAAHNGNAELLSSLAGNGPLSNGGTSLSALQALRAQQATLQGQLNQMQVKFGPAYPKVSEVAANLSAVTTAVHDEVERIAQRAETDFQVADRTYRNAKKDYEQQKAQADSLNDRAIQYVMARQEADETRGLYEDLLKRLKEAGIFEAMRASSIEVTDPALTPTQAAKPKALLLLGGGLGVGVFIGAVLAFMLELLGDKVYDAEEFRFLGVPIAGVLPGTGSPERLARFDGAREAILLGLRTILLRSVEAVDTPVVLVAEVTGQSQHWDLPLMLARGMASQGKRVLLVQADACAPLSTETKPEATKKQPLPLLHVPAERKALPEPEQNVKVLAANDSTLEPLKNPDSKKMKKLREEWRPAYDIVIVQAAPILPYSEAQRLADSADVVVLSTVLGQTSRTSVLRAHEALKAHGARQMLLIAEEGKSRGAYRNFYGMPLQARKIA